MTVKLSNGNKQISLVYEKREKIVIKCCDHPTYKNGYKSRYTNYLKSSSRLTDGVIYK